jgi:hypothetical protein
MERVMGYLVAWAYDFGDWWARTRLAQHAAERREKVRKWEQASGQQEVGEYCLTDQMQF